MSTVIILPLNNSSGQYHSILKNTNGYYHSTLNTVVIFQTISVATIIQLSNNISGFYHYTLKYFIGYYRHTLIQQQLLLSLYDFKKISMAISRVVIHVRSINTIQVVTSILLSNNRSDFYRYTRKQYKQVILQKQDKLQIQFLQQYNK